MQDASREPLVAVISRRDGENAALTYTAVATVDAYHTGYALIETIDYDEQVVVSGVVRKSAYEMREEGELFVVKAAVEQEGGGMAAKGVSD